MFVFFNYSIDQIREPFDQNWNKGPSKCQYFFMNPKKPYMPWFWWCHFRVVLDSVDEPLGMFSTFRAGQLEYIIIQYSCEITAVHKHKIHFVTKYTNRSEYILKTYSKYNVLCFMLILNWNHTPSHLHRLLYEICHEWSDHDSFCK